MWDTLQVIRVPIFTMVVLFTAPDGCTLPGGDPTIIPAWSPGVLAYTGIPGPAGVFTLASVLAGSGWAGELDLDPGGVRCLTGMVTGWDFIMVSGPVIVLLITDTGIDPVIPCMVLIMGKAGTLRFITNLSPGLEHQRYHHTDTNRPENR